MPDLLKNQKVIDYSTRKKEVPPKKLMRCPKCGRIGCLKKYKNGMKMYQHVLHVKSWCIEVVDSCIVRG